MQQPFPDPADEEKREVNCGTTVTYRKYACLFDENTGKWYTHTCHPNAIAYIQSGCTLEGTDIPPVFVPTPRPSHSQDIVGTNGRKKFYMGYGSATIRPTGYIRVNRND